MTRVNYGKSLQQLKFEVEYESVACDNVESLLRAYSLIFDEIEKYLLAEQTNT